MKTIYESRGYFYLSGFNDEDIPEWVTTDYNGNTTPYFHLNCATRRKFATDLLPLVKTGDIHISATTYKTIASYKALPAVVNTTDSQEIVEPEGIELLPHQRDAVSLMLKHDRFGFFMEPGTGKTFIAISFLLSRQIEKALIVTPKKVISQYKENLEQYTSQIQYDVINYESLHKVSTNKYDCLILDESHYVKNYSTKANEILRKMSNNIRYIYLFTGTPADKSKVEIFPQLAILDSRYIPSKTRFNHRYYTLDDYYNPKREKKIVSDELSAMIAESTWGVQAENVIDLPPEIDHIIYCSKPALYDKLHNDRVLEADDLDFDDAEVIADTPAALNIKKRELCNGHITATDLNTNKPIVVFQPSVKQDELVKILNTLKNAIIYTQFYPDIEDCIQACGRADKSYTIVTGTSKNADACINSFKSGEVDCLIIQSRCGNAGLNLTNTNNIIFYALPESYIVFYQCKCRVRRYGQTKPCNYYYLLCENTIEERVYKSLKSKKSFSTKLYRSY